MNYKLIVNFKNCEVSEIYGLNNGGFIYLFDSSLPLLNTSVDLNLLNIKI